MVGRLAPWKGQHVFLRGSPALPVGPVPAIIVGAGDLREGDYLDAWQLLAHDLGIAERVDFLGFVDIVGGLLQPPTSWCTRSVIAEPFGQVVIEGMAAGLPVIASAAAVHSRSSPTTSTAC